MKRSKRWLSFLLVVIACVGVTGPAAGALTVPPVYDASATVPLPHLRTAGNAFQLFEAEIGQPVPLRAAVESCGGTVTWNDGVIEIIHESLTATLAIGSGSAVVDGEETELDFAPYINENGRTVVSYALLRPIFVEENDEYAALKDYSIPIVYELMDTLDVAGMTLSVVDLDNGDPAWNQGFGYADVENSVTVSEDTLFEVGSISKTFTAFGVMQLVEQGLMDLDASITAYLPDLAVAPHPDRGGEAADITLRSIGTHTSGIQGSILPYFIGYDQTLASSQFNSIVTDLNDSYLVAQVGDTQAYSNTAITLMGAALAKTAYPELNYLDGFTRYMDENVFNKMGMTGATFVPGEGANVSKSYATATAGAQDTLYIAQLPAGSLTASAADMAKYMETLLSGGTYAGSAVLTQPGVDALLTPAAVDSDRFTLGSKMGFVWMTEDVGTPIMQHGGDTVYFHSMVMLNRDTNLGVFLSANTATGASAASLLCGQILLSAMAEKNGAEPVLSQYPETQDITLSTNALLPYTGLYSYPSVCGYLNEDDQLTLSLLGEDFELIPQSDGTFLDIDGMRYKFEETESGGLALSYLLYGTEFYYLCDVLGELSTEHFGAFTGKWTHVPMENDTYINTLYGGDIVLNLSTEPGYPAIVDSASGLNAPLVCLDETTCYQPGYGRDEGYVIDLVDMGGVTCLRYMGMLFVKA